MARVCAKGWIVSIWRPMATLALAGVLSTVGLPQRGEEPQQAASSTVRPTFAETDAVRILSGLRTALEENRRNRLLKLFDARRMPNYAAFRDQVTAFFDKYDSFSAQYQLKQVRMDGEFGALLADFVLEATTPDTTQAALRRSVQMRLIVVWDGKQWKVVDLSPRSLFQ